MKKYKKVVRISTNTRGLSWAMNPEFGIGASNEFQLKLK